MVGFPGLGTSIIGGDGCGLLAEDDEEEEEEDEEASEGESSASGESVPSSLSSDELRSEDVQSFSISESLDTAPPNVALSISPAAGL